MSRISKLCLIAVLGPMLAGCSALHLSGLKGKSKSAKGKEDGPVMDLLCLWEPGEGRNLDNLPGRGFAGQLMFLRQGSDEPTIVDGDIRIYLFDDQGAQDEQAVPIHQFDFPSLVWNQYARKTNLGPAYQLFIPYTRKGPHEASCALRVRFTPADGSPPVYSKMAHVTLPGSRSEVAKAWKPQRTQQSVAARSGYETDPAVEQAVHEVMSRHGSKTPGKAVTDIRLASAQREGAASGRAAQLARLQQLMEPTVTEEGGDPAAEPETDESSSTTTPRRYQLRREVATAEETAAASPSTHPLADMKDEVGTGK